MAKQPVPAIPTVTSDHEPTLTKTQQRELVRARKALAADLDGFLSKELECAPKDFIDDGWRVFEYADVSTRAIVDILRDDVVLRVEAPIMRVPTDKAVAARLMNPWGLPGALRQLLADRRALPAALTDRGVTAEALSPNRAACRSC